MTIEQRLDRLERQNRFMKRAGAAVLCVVVVSAAGLFSASPAYSQTGKPIEQWKCYSLMDFFGDKEKVIVKALRYAIQEHIDGSFTLGEIHVAGQAYVAIFTVDGFDRTWDFGPMEAPEEGTVPVFRFVIRPDGAGLYYDFSDLGKGEKTTPSQTFKCVEK